MSFVDASCELTASERVTLLRIARGSVAHGLQERSPLPVTIEDYSESLRAFHPCFATLRFRDRLRGCMGSLQPTLPLVQAAAYHAFQAAFHDPRFPPLKPEEFSELSVSLSILSASEALECTSEEDLLSQLRPGLDGVILETRKKTATLLPQVWDHVTDPREFLLHLKRKAGVAENVWSSEWRFRRYRAVSLVEPAPVTPAREDA